MADNPTVIIKCNEVLISVPVSILCQESTEFNKRFAVSSNEDSNVESAIDEDRDQISRQGSVVKSRAIDLSEYSNRSVQTLFDFLQGCELLIKSCTCFQAFEDMIQMCVKFGIKRPLPAISARMKTYGIIFQSNVVEAFEVAERLQKNEDFRAVAEEITDHCIMMARFNLNSKQAMINFLLSNKSKKEHALKLLDVVANSSSATIKWKVVQSKKNIDYLTPYCILTPSVHGFAECQIEMAEFDEETSLIGIKPYHAYDKSSSIEWKMLAVGGKEGKDFIFLDRSKGSAHAFPSKKIENCKEIFLEAKINNPLLDQTKLYTADFRSQEHDTIWSVIECEDLDSLMKRSNMETDFPDSSSIILDCQGTHVCAKKSDLFKESTYFESRFGAYWSGKENVENHNNLKGNLIECNTITIPDNFDPKALKIIVDLLHGFDDKFAAFLETVAFKDLTLLCNIFDLCDYYGIVKPLKEIVKKLEKCPILVAFELAQKLEKMPFYEKLAASLKAGYRTIAHEKLVDFKSIAKFVDENKRKIDTVVDFFAEIGPLQPEYVLRIKLHSYQNLDFSFHNIKWKLLLQIDQDHIPEACASLFIYDIRDISSKTSLTVELECVIYKVDDWSRHTILKSEATRLDATHREVDAHLVNDESTPTSVDLIYKDDVAYCEVIVRILETENLPDNTDWKVKEDQLYFPELTI